MATTESVLSASIPNPNSNLPIVRTAISQPSLDIRVRLSQSFWYGREPPSRDVLQQFGRSDRQRSSQFYYVDQADIPRSTLNSTYIVPMQVRMIGQRLLRKSTTQAEPA